MVNPAYLHVLATIKETIKAMHLRPHLCQNAE